MQSRCDEKLSYKVAISSFVGRLGLKYLVKMTGGKKKKANLGQAVGKFVDQRRRII